MPRGGRREGAGRPIGSISKTTAEIKTLAQAYGAAAITALAELAGLAPGTRAEAETARISAIKELLDRAYGRSTQPLSGDTEAPPLRVDFRWADATPTPQPEPDEADVEARAAGFIVAFATDESTC
jgi:hypothetical protein